MRAFYIIFGVLYVCLGATLMASLVYVAWQGSIAPLIAFPLPALGAAFGIVILRSLACEVRCIETGMTLQFPFRIERIPWDSVESYRNLAAPFGGDFSGQVKGMWVMLKYKQIRDAVVSKRIAFIVLPSVGPILPMSVKECTTVLDQYIPTKNNIKKGKEGVSS